MAIEWDKILDKPVKEYKVKGDQLLALRQKIDAQEKQIAELTKVRNELTATGDSLKKNLSKLESETLNKEKKIGALEASIKEKESKAVSLESELKEKDDKLSSLESELKEKNEKLSSLESDIAEKGQKSTSLDGKVTELNESLSQKEAKITELTEELSAKTTKSAELDNQNNELKTQLSTSNEKISEYETQITTLTTNLDNLQKNVMAKDEEIETLNTKITELKELIPKKPVYEKAEEVVKGAGCPKCGWTTVEEYKIVDGKRLLIRKYCPNTFCMWTSTEEPKITITMTSEAPKAEKKEILLFQVVGTGVKEIKALDSSMVALITDPAQSTVWVWKGQKSSRFDYSEATNLATKIKNEVLKITHARIVRVDQGKEPSNFPKL